MDETSTCMYENTNDWRLKSFGVIGDKKVTLISTLPSAWIVNILEVAVYSAEVWLAFGALCAPIQLNVFPSTRTNPVQPSTCPLQPVSHVPAAHARVTYAQNVGHCPGKYPPSGLSPPCNHTLKYGFLTASGIAGGRAGENVEVIWAVAVVSSAPSAPSTQRRIMLGCLESWATGTQKAPCVAPAYIRSTSACYQRTHAMPCRASMALQGADGQALHHGAES
jgi:hypothetical protein